MAKLTYSAITSLDGYVADELGNFDWAEPDPQVHAFVNDLERGIGTYLYGRRMYEVMSAWETLDSGDDPTGDVDAGGRAMADYAKIWRAADKVVFSTTLREASSARTEIVKLFDPALVQSLKQAAPSDISIGGPGLAAHAIKAGLVDDFHQFLNPVIVGAGTYWLPADVRVTLDLVDEHRFDNGVVHLHYRSS